MKILISSIVGVLILGLGAEQSRADPFNQKFIPVAQSAGQLPPQSPPQANPRSPPQAPWSFPEATQRTISIIGRERATVTRAEIRVADIADVNSRLTRDDEAVIALQRILISKSPGPGEQITLSAQQVLEAMKRGGADVNKVGYTLPRIIIVERAARSVGEEEVRTALHSLFERTGREAEIRTIQMPKDIRVAPQAIEIEPIERPSTRSGGDAFQMVVKQDGQRVASFDVQATLEEWREMPVARRPLARGSVIGAADLVMARMNMSALPRDAANNDSGIVGLRLNQEIAPGEVFRKQHLFIPPLVEAGQRVSLVYRSRLLEASAVGIALQQGAKGDVVSVRNENSKKVVSGVVTESGVVEVRP